MSAHTPAPWTGPYRHIDGQDVILSPANIVIAWLGERWTGPAEHEQAANARLIAAAPDLLAALQMTMFKPNVGPSADERFEAARAAIAKATGGDQ